MLKKKRRRSLQYKNESKVADKIDSDDLKKKRKAKRKEKIQKNTDQLDEALIVKKPKRKSKYRFVYSAIIIGMIALIGMTVYSVISQQMEYKKVIAEQEALKREKAKLEHELKQVDTLEYIEDQARSVLRMVKPGEILYIIPEPETEND